MTYGNGSVAVRISPFDQLSAEEIESWHRLRNANPALDSPYFHPRFAETVHASGRAVDVVVSRGGDGQVNALLAGHRDKAVFRPVGWPGADFQGPIVAPGTSVPPLDLLTDGVRSFEFDHLLDSYPEFEPWVDSTHASPFLDTSGGLTGYLGRVSSTGKDNMGQARRRAAKAERTHGTVRFTAFDSDPNALAEVIRLKREQYAATGARDYFAVPDRIDLMNRLLRIQDPAFGGILSTLYAGPHLLAAHFGIRSGSVLHWWFPVYDPAFSSLSPGWILLRELVDASPALGINRIDLGKGDDEYKRRAKTGEDSVCEGMVTRSKAHQTLRRGRDQLINTAKASPLGPGLRRVVRAVRSARS